MGETKYSLFQFQLFNRCQVTHVWTSTNNMTIRISSKRLVDCKNCVPFNIFHFQFMNIMVNEFFTYMNTVKPVNNGHPWDLEKVAVWKRCLIKLRFRLVVDDSNWPLLTGGRYSEVVIRTGLTVYHNPFDVLNGQT